MRISCDRTLPRPPTPHPTPLSTCRERQLDLLVNDLQSDEVMLFVEASVVEQQAIGLSGGKPVNKDQVLHSKGGTGHSGRLRKDIK